MSLEAQVQAAVIRAFNLAGDLIGDVYLTRKVHASYDPATGDASRNEGRYKFRGVVASVAEREIFSRNSAAALGSEVESTTNKVFLEPREDGVAPESGDVVRAGEESYRIEEVKPIKPNGVTVLLWELKVTV